MPRAAKAPEWRGAMAISVDKKKTALLVVDCENDLAHQDRVIAKTMPGGDA